MRTTHRITTKPVSFIALAMHISGMVGPIAVKRKGSTSVGYWAEYVTLTFDLTQDLDLVCFKVKFQNSSFSGIVGLIDVK